MLQDCNCFLNEHLNDNDNSTGMEMAKVACSTSYCNQVVPVMPLIGISK